MIDIFIVFVYLAALLFIGIFSRQKSGRFTDFARIKDGAQRGRLILVATIFASSIGGGTTFGISEKTFAGDISHSYGLFIAIIADLLIAAFIIPRLTQHYGAETPGDIMHSYYGKSGRYITGISTILISMGLVAAQISVSGRIFEYILQIDFVKGVLISYGIVIVYSTIGGFRSVLFTNGLQFFAILIAIPIITIFGIYKIGLIEFWSSIPGHKISFVANEHLLSSTISAALGFCVMNLFPTFIQRALINKKPQATQKAIYTKSLIYAVFLVLITLNGLIAYNLFPDQSPSLALPILIDSIIPVGLQGIVIVGLLAAVMSTADSDLNITSVSLAKDFLKPLFGIYDQTKLLFFARASNLILGSFAIYLALNFSSIVDLVIFVAGFWGPVVLVPLVFALFGVVIKTYQMSICCLLGGVSFAFWELLVKNNYMNLSACGIELCYLKGVFIGAIVNLLCFLLFLLWNRIIVNYIAIR